MQPREVTVSELGRNGRRPRPIPILQEQPPLEFCGVRHPLYNAEGGARVCSWIHMLSAVIAFCASGILCYDGAEIGWSMTAGVAFLLTGASGIIAYVYRLTLTVLVSMVTCFISATFAAILIIWAVFCMANYVEGDNVDVSTIKVVLSVQVILGVCGIAELITDIIHAIKAIRIICCFRDETRLKRRGSKIVKTPSLKYNESRPKSLVIKNPAAVDQMYAKGCFYLESP